MRTVAPRIGLPEVSLAKDQEEYLETTGAIAEFADGNTAVVTRWCPTDDERARLLAGEDLFLTLLTFGGPVQPMQLTVGAPLWAPGEPTA